MVNQHSVDYQTSPSGSTSMVHPLIFLQTPKDFFFLQNFYLIFPLTGWGIFYTCHPGKNLPYVFSITPQPQTERNYSSPLDKIFSKIYSPSQKGVETMATFSKIQKWLPKRTCSQQMSPLLGLLKLPKLLPTSSLAEAYSFI